MRYVHDRVLRAYEVAPVWTRSAASTLYGFVKSRREETPEFRHYLRECEESQWWTLARLREWQQQRLAEILKHAATRVPYYRRLFAEHGLAVSQLQTPEDLQRVPLLTREHVRAHRQDLLAEGVTPAGLRWESTSGTSGVPLRVAMDSATYLRIKAVQWLQHAWAGYTHREWLGVFAGYRVIPPGVGRPPFWVTNYAGRQIHFSTYHLNPSFLPAYADRLESEPIGFLLGYPSAIGVLARFLRQNGRTIPMKGIFLSSEPVLPWQESAIRSAFECPVFNYYGQAERVIAAMGCGSSLSMHLSMETALTEFFRPNHLPDPVRLVGTSLTNRVMPLIRYALEDLTTEENVACPCGRAHVRIGPVQTAADSLVVTPSGTMIPPSLFYIPFQGIEQIAQCQVVQEDATTLVACVVPAKGYGPDIEDVVRRRLVAIVGAGMRIEVSVVHDIPRTAHGKSRFVVSRISQDGAERKAP
jgi:phenylacetate-CoA ligase